MYQTLLTLHILHDTVSDKRRVSVRDSKTRACYLNTQQLWNVAAFTCTAAKRVSVDAPHLGLVPFSSVPGRVRPEERRHEKLVSFVKGLFASLTD